MTGLQVSQDRDTPRAAWAVDLTTLPRTFLRASFVVVAVVAFLHLVTTDYFVANVLGRTGEDGDAGAIRNLFQMEYEQSIPTWLGTMLLMACGLVLLAIGRFETNRGSSLRFAWLSLGVIFVLMSLDEHVGIHEVANIYLGRLWHGTGYFAYEWVVPGSVFVALAAVYYWRAFGSLPRPYPLLFFGAGGLYLLGALFTEMIEAKVATNPDSSELALMLSFIVQDPFEFIGASLFLYALMRYCIERLGWSQVSLGAPGNSASPAA